MRRSTPGHKQSSQYFPAPGKARARRKAAGEMGETTGGILFGILGHINSRLLASPNLSLDILEWLLFTSPLCLSGAAKEWYMSQEIPEKETIFLFPKSMSVRL